MNLEKMNLVELEAQEKLEIEGGGRGRAIKKFLEWVGYFDAVDSFVEGWNSVPTQC